MMTTTIKTTTIKTTTRVNTNTRALGGFGPNVSAEEIRKKQDAKKKLIEANKAKALAAKNAQKPSSNAFNARKNSQQTIASVPARKNRTMPGAAAKKPATIGSKTIGSKKTTTTSSKAKDAEPKKKLFGLF